MKDEAPVAKLPSFSPKKIRAYNHVL